MAEKIECDHCGKQLTPDMEIEHSGRIGEYFCGHKCAIDRYFDYMESLPIVDEAKEKLFREGKT